MKLLLLILFISCGKGGEVASIVASITSSKNNKVADSTIPTGKTRFLYQMNSASIEVYKNDGYGTYTKIDTEIITAGTFIQIEQNFLFANSRESNPTDVAFRSYKIEADGTLTLAAMMGAYSNTPSNVVISPDATTYYASDVSGTVFQRTFNTTTYVSSLGVNTAIGTGIGLNPVTVSNSGLWGVGSDSRLYRSNEAVTTNVFKSITSSAAFITTFMIGASEHTITAIGSNLLNYRQGDPSGVDNVIVYAGGNTVGNVTSLISDAGFVYVTTDNHDVRVLTHSIVQVANINICTNGKLESVDSQIVTINCGTYVQTYQFIYATTTPKFVKILDIDTGVNPVKTIVKHW